MVGSLGLVKFQALILPIQANMLQKLTGFVFLSFGKRLVIEIIYSPWELFMPEGHQLDVHLAILQRHALSSGEKALDYAVD